MIGRLAKARAAASARLRARLARVSRRQLRSGPLIAHEEVRSGRNSQDDRSWLRYLSALPEDARAVLEPLPTATNQGGRARKGQWRLSFPQRKKPFVDWLMGWTGGEDPLVQVDLRFPTREAAEAGPHSHHGAVFLVPDIEPTSFALHTTSVVVVLTM